MSNITDPTHAMPVEIDTELARLWQIQAAAESNRDQILGRLDKPAWSAEQADQLRDALDNAKRTIADCQAQAEPLTAEYRRRGGWTRAWLVTNSNGHVHRHTDCRTCFPTTEFAWLTNLSGHDETEIVELAGKSACTECYPSAPVEIRQRASRIKTPQQLERDAQKAQRAKDKAAKAITAADGKPLSTSHYGTINTEVTARRSYADAIAYARYLARDDIAHHRELIAEHQQDAQTILTALAAKHQLTVDDMRDDLGKAVESRWRREYSKWK